MAKSFIKFPGGSCDTTPQEVDVYFGGGKDGLSAYQSAVLGGYEGTEEQFYAELGNINPDFGLPESSETGFVQV